jgi:uncharacterized small protein (DUF1192 family)
MELHPLCTLFPRLVDAEFLALVADIRAHGLRVPITIHDGMILDGGNRYRACVQAGVEPVTQEFDGDNLASFVLSVNLHRRHMTPGQQAAIVASAADWHNANGHGGDRKSKHYQALNQGAALPIDSANGRAATSGASVRTQKMADKVAKASPETAKKVAHGELSLPAAVAQVEGKEKPKKPEAEDVGYNGPSEEEIAAAVKDAEADIKHLGEIMAADDRIAAFESEHRRIRAELAAVKSSRDGYMNRCCELVDRIKSLKRKLAKCEASRG